MDRYRLGAYRLRVTEPRLFKASDLDAADGRSVG